MMSKFRNSDAATRGGALASARAFLARFRRETSGGVLVYFALLLSVLLGAAGLSVDISYWYSLKRSTQSAADSAALAGIAEVRRGGDEAGATRAAEKSAYQNGFDAKGAATVTINFPPASGLYKGDDTAVEAIVQQQSRGFLSRLFLKEAPVIASRAVALSVPMGSACVLALDPDAKSAMKVNSGTVVTDGCAVQVNSNDGSALDVPNTGSVEADPINVAGDVTGGGYISSDPNIGAPVISDPLQGLPEPTFSGCDHNDVSFSGGSHTLSPGVYCGGIALSGSAEVTLEPGEYIIADGSGGDPGQLSTSGSSSSLVGDGVSFFFDGSANANMTGNGQVNLSSPSSGVYEGVLFYGDQEAPTSTNHTIAGGGDLVFDGVMYFPTAELRYMGNGEGATDTKISAVIARVLKFGGNGTFNFHYDEDANVPVTMAGSVTLVE
jgi:hypothetical protein